ncbi:hypothetical protein [Lutibacter sp.]|uniref:hypothetical protein n=1 Tax=Lutibacter sp. TaxID=1925666 RepID=UPI0027360260|nr:hypothetical protein [Lutibacter sp.]MDP3313993.1 hypothetical protein [Lutibacter sp.]
MELTGKKIIELKSITSSDVVCSNCNKQNTTKISVFGIYKHLFYIPFFSGGKNGHSECENCAKQFNLKTMPNPVKLAYYELKETVKTPIWFYTGLIGIKTLVIIKIVSNYL